MDTKTQINTLSVATLKQIIRDLPFQKKLRLIIWPAIFITIVVVALSIYAVDTLSSIRAGVAGEDAWAKSVNSMIYNLGKYAVLREEKYFNDYVIAQRISKAQGIANHELLKPIPNKEILKTKLLDADIHPDDIPGVIRLFINYRNAPHVKEAILAWFPQDQVRCLNHSSS